MRPSDSVTIVRELILQLVNGLVPGVPSAHVIRLLPDGSLCVEGPVAPDRAVSRAAQLLDGLLPPFDAAREIKVPGALRLVIARALGTLDVPPYGSLEQFAAALERFADPDPASRFRELAAAWAAVAGRATAGGAVQPPAAPVHRERGSDERDDWRAGDGALVCQPGAAVTVSDIRRARRATRLSLHEISGRSRIPVALLRQLEWGYLRNWPADAAGRSLLTRYARAAGLDERLVLTAIRPLVESVEPREEPEVAVEAVEVRRVVEAPLVLDDLPLNQEATGPIAERGGPWRRRGAIAAAVGVAAMLALVVLPPLPDAPSWEQVAHSGDSRPAPEGADRARLPSAEAGIEPRKEVAAAEQAAGNGAPAASRASASRPTASNPAHDVAQPARGSSDVDASWSPSLASAGSAVFYTAQGPERGAPGLLQAGSAGESVLLRITRVVDDDDSRSFHARPSPDGQRIAFDSNRDGERGVYVANADGTDVRRVTGEGFAAIPSWSPDGRSLAVVRAEPDRPAVWNLWLVDLESGEMRRLTSNRSGRPWGASWFPDGRRLAYCHGSRLVVLDVGAGRERGYPSPRRGRPLRTPAVAPDGRRIMFQVHGDGAWLLDLKDGTSRRILADPSAEDYTWSPDGRRVAFFSRQSGQWGVWRVAPG